MGTDVSRWGLVVAAPHQHLIAIRRGRVVRSEQGGSHFRWPWDTVALVDTSVHRLQFSADQVTREKAGVRTAELEAEAQRTAGAARADVEGMLRAAQDGISDERLRELLLTETLPRVAEAFRDSVDQVTVTGGDMGFLAQGLSQVLATMRAHGMEPEALLGGRERTD